MILDKQVLMRVNSRTAQTYKDKGYDIPMRMGSHGHMVFDTDAYFYVNVEDLEPTSTVDVHTECDICKTPKIMPYREYYRQLDENGLRTCINCKTIKSRKSNLEKYGVEYISQLDSVKEKVIKTNQEKRGVNWCMQSQECLDKRKQTCLERYGCESPRQLESVKEKAVQTNLKRYGVVNPFMNKEIQDKMKATLRDKYGTENLMDIPVIREKIAITNLERYGHKCSLGNTDVYAKGLQTKYKNGTIATSTQQEYICNLYNGTLNFPCSHYNLDIVLDNIDIEYDGGGHQLSVELGNISQHDFDVKQTVRDKIVKSNGYKIIRLISKSDNLPSDEVLLHILDLSKEYFNSTSHTWVEWYFDENKFRNADNMYGSYFDFGVLRNIRNKTT